LVPVPEGRDPVRMVASHAEALESGGARSALGPNEATKRRRGPLLEDPSATNSLVNGVEAKGIEPSTSCMLSTSTLLSEVHQSPLAILDLRFCPSASIQVQGSLRRLTPPMTPPRRSRCPAVGVAVERVAATSVKRPLAGWPSLQAPRGTRVVILGVSSRPPV
jgi:hypothetical protein